MHELPILDFQQLIQALPKRDKNAHKGDYGHVLVIGGDYGYPGAPVLSAMGALRAGAGLVTLASHQAHINGLNAAHPEIMCHAIDDLQNLRKLLQAASVVVLGPGLGRTDWSQQVYDVAINTAHPLILDGDGLFFLAQKPSKNRNRIITPHPMEAARLLQQTQPIAQDMRERAVQQLIAQYDSTVVLKGAGTLVGSALNHMAICNLGNPGMASGGMGDLLSGVIAGLVAQGLGLDFAARLGVCVHGLAGDMAAKTGQRGIIASDLLMPIKQLLQ